MVLNSFRTRQKIKMVFSPATGGLFLFKFIP
jgi:hypothetical protein